MTSVKEVVENPSKRAPLAVACIDLPAFPAQIVLRDRPAWRGAPLAIVADDRPDALLLHVNDRARALRLCPGMRYGAALNLVPELRAAPMPAHRVAKEVAELGDALGAFSPRVEPDSHIAGVFFVDPRGLGGLYGSLETWARSVHAYLVARGYIATVVVGFGRFPTFAIARVMNGPRVLDSPATCRRLAAGVPLARLDLSPHLRDGLAELGVHTIGDLLAIPPGPLRTRFGEEADRLHQQASGSQELPLLPLPQEEAPRVSFQIDPPDADRERLLFGIKGALHELLRSVVDRHQAIAALELAFFLEDRCETPLRERLEPASPTRDALVLVDLVRLRLDAMTIERSVEEIALGAECVAPSEEQLTLFATTVPDARAANRALARIRAAFGPLAVSRAALREAHLPEARFTWEPVASVTLPRVFPAQEAATDRDTTDQPLVRRVFSPPRALATRVDKGAFAQLFGPYRTSGGWWVRVVDRDYYYAETRERELLWIFYDRSRERWFIHGLID